MGNAFSLEVGIVPLLSLMVALFALYSSFGMNLGWWPFPSKSEEQTVKMNDRDCTRQDILLSKLMQSAGLQKEQNKLLEEQNKLLKEQNKLLEDISHSIDTIAKKTG